MPRNEPNPLNFTLPAGDSALIKMRIFDPFDKPLDITGMVLKYSAEKIDDPTHRIDLTEGSGITVIAALTGDIEILIPVGDMTEPGKHLNEVQLQDGVDSQVVAEGIITVTRSLNPSE